MLELNRIYNMDCIEGMKLIDDKSIGLIVTEAIASIKNNRQYIGFELSEEYCKIAEKRISEFMYKERR